MILSFDAIKNHMTPYEGNVQHMYLDTVGKVTVGIGNMLPDVSSAQKLPFINRLTRNPATLLEIKADYDAVTTQPRAQFHSRYRPFTKLDLSDVDIDELFRARIAAFERELTAIYPKYNQFPGAARLALLDMAFNLGCGALKRHWPKLNQAVNAGDWTNAASNCERPQAQPARNAGVKALLVAASRDAARP